MSHQYDEVEEQITVAEATDRLRAKLEERRAQAELHATRMCSAGQKHYTLVNSRRTDIIAAFEAGARWQQNKDVSK